MRLFHFSEDDSIGRFVPRPVATASARPPGREWLNGPLVWAIDEWHQPMYFFPRDCPRILVWPTDRTSERDRRAFRATTSHRMVASWSNAGCRSFRKQCSIDTTCRPPAFKASTMLGCGSRAATSYRRRARRLGPSCWPCAAQISRSDRWAICWLCAAYGRHLFTPAASGCATRSAGHGKTTPESERPVRKPRPRLQNDNLPPSVDAIAA